MNLLRHEHEKGRSIILITHDMEIAKQGDSVRFLEGGILHKMVSSDDANSDP